VADRWFDPQDLAPFNEGWHGRLGDILGAHQISDGVGFAVWAPGARNVSVLHDANGWTAGADRLTPVGSTGVWAGFVAGMGNGTAYKYAIETAEGHILEKADPVAAFAEHPPATASRVWTSSHVWADAAWMAGRDGLQSATSPVVIYEMHLGSWRRMPEEGGRPLTYREMAPLLADHLDATGFNFVEFLPVMEHPFDPSWGYQTTGYFAPTSRFGTPDDFMYLVDHLHQRGIGVILDWVPSHFPTDAHALARFDGTALYEHEDPRQGFHPDWKSAIFNYGRHEVRSFLLSSAAWWIEKFHIDGLRVDAVASMLYLDYSRDEGEWIPNEHGGNENYEAIGFIRQLTDMVHHNYPGVAVYAEESTAWPGVTTPTEHGGLGFDSKWDMGWMHDTLGYFAHDPVHRAHHHNALTFRSIYADSEQFTLALSHDEVVHGKGSLLRKMPGDRWQQFANVRLLFSSMYTLPGKKLLFMGDEFAQPAEWAHNRSLDWDALTDPAHAGVLRLVGDLGRIYRHEPSLHQDRAGAGFRWVIGDDATNSVYAYLRIGPSGEQMLVVLNATPVVRHGYRIGVPTAGAWRRVLDSDALVYGGSGAGGPAQVVRARATASHGFDSSIEVDLPPLAALALVPEQ
jgi:1,4-alpha-glucan branching enzyme